MIAWDDYFKAANAEIDRAMFAVAPPPTRSETIKAMWDEHGRKLWPIHSTPAGMVLAHDLGIIPPAHYEMKRYGDFMVVEAEGVIVEKVAIPPR